MREDSDTAKDYSRVQHKGNRRVVLPPEGLGMCWGIGCLPLHRTEASYPYCGTCDGGGCLDCTDSAY